MNKPLISKDAESSLIKKFDIISNEDQSKKISLTNGTVRLMYYESVLQDTVKCTFTFADTGNSVPMDGSYKSVMEGLPLVGEEKILMSIEDNNETKIDLTLYVNKVTPSYEDSQKSLITIDCVSKEFILNEKVRVNTRFDGKLSDHITKILTDQKFLNTDKNIDIEETENNYNFIGDNKKPFYLCTWLYKKGIPIIPNAKGNTAGFFFF